jgi:hypothetical protein
MSHLTRWLRATFDFNPAFPLSALALLIGLRLLAEEGGAQGPLAEALLASGILQAYEALLLGVGLLILWPRRVTYETTAILIILGVVRFAAPFLAARLAGEGELVAALALGLGTWALSTFKVEAAARRIGLAWSARERSWRCRFPPSDSRARPGWLGATRPGAESSSAPGGAWRRSWLRSRSARSPWVSPVRFGADAQRWCGAA